MLMPHETGLMGRSSVITTTTARSASSTTSLTSMFRSMNSTDLGVGKPAKPTLTGSVEEYFDLIRERAALGFLNKRPVEQKQHPREEPRPDWIDNLILKSLKEAWPELAATQVPNQISSRRLCFNISAPVASYIRPLSIHTPAEALTIITYLDNEDNLCLGLRWWFFTWSAPIQRSSSSVVDYVHHGEQAVEGGQQQRLPDEQLRKLRIPSPVLENNFAVSVDRAVATLLSIVRGLFDGKLKVRADVWFDPESEQRLVKTYLVPAEEPDVPADASKFETVLTLAWNGHSFSSADGKPFILMPSQKISNLPFVLTSAHSTGATPSSTITTTSTTSTPGGWERKSLNTR